MCTETLTTHMRCDCTITQCTGLWPTMKQAQEFATRRGEKSHHIASVPSAGCTRETEGVCGLDGKCRCPKSKVKKQRSSKMQNGKRLLMFRKMIFRWWKRAGRKNEEMRSCCKDEFSGCRGLNRWVAGMGCSTAMNTMLPSRTLWW